MSTTILPNWPALVKPKEQAKLREACRALAETMGLSDRQESIAETTLTDQKERTRTIRVAPRVPKTNDLIQLPEGSVLKEDLSF